MPSSPASWTRADGRPRPDGIAPKSAYIESSIGVTTIADEQNQDEERPCLHCLIVETIDSFFAEYPVSAEEPEAVDTDEIVTAIAKTVAELTCGLDSIGRQAMLEQLTREIADYDAEFRQQDALGSIGSAARH